MKPLIILVCGEIQMIYRIYEKVSVLLLWNPYSEIWPYFCVDMYFWIILANFLPKYHFLTQQFLLPPGPWLNLFDHPTPISADSPISFNFLFTKSKSSSRKVFNNVEKTKLINLISHTIFLPPGQHFDGFYHHICWLSTKSLPPDKPPLFHSQYITHPSAAVWESGNVSDLLTLVG